MDPNDPTAAGGDQPVDPAAPPTPPAADQPFTPPPTPPPPPGGGQYPPPAAYPPPPPTSYPPPPAAGGGQYGPPGGMPPGATPPPAPNYGQPGPGPAGYGAPNYGGQVGAVGPAPFSPTNALAYGWRAFQANTGPLVVIVAVIFLVNAIIQWLSNWVSDSDLLGLLMALVSILVSMILSLGLLRVALMIVDGKVPTVADVFKTDELGVYFVASVISTVVISIGLVLCIIPGLIAAFLLSLFGYSILDQVEGGVKVAKSSAVGALRTSYEVASKNVGSLLLLFVLSAIFNMVGAVLCLVGLLVSVPVTAVALAYAWRHFTNGPVTPRFAAAG